MDLKKLIKLHGSHLAILCAVLSFLFFISACLVQSETIGFLLTIPVVLSLCTGGLLLFLWNRWREKRVHFFLYDRRRAQMRPQTAITPQHVQDSMDFYLTPYVKSNLALFHDLPKQLRLQLESEPYFRPLVMYRMLSALSEAEDETLLATFSAADTRVISYLCRALSDADDGEMADFIYHLRKNAQEDPDRIAPFFKRNAKYFATRSMRYIDRNFEKFYVERSRFERIKR